MHADLRELDTKVTVCLRELDALQTQVTPVGRSAGWSIQEIVEHLLLTYRSSIPAIEERIAKGRPTGRRLTLRQRVGQFYVLTLGRFPRGRRAPAAVSPAAELAARTGYDLAMQVHRELVRLDAVSRVGERTFGARRAVSHGVLGPLSMGQWRRFHLVHGLHHLQQVRAICRENGFASALRVSVQTEASAESQSAQKLR